MKLLIIDLDNTLLKNDKTISEYTTKILRSCPNYGIYVYFATARSVQAVKKLMEQVLPSGFIGYGGGLIISGGKEIARFEIPIEVSNNLIKNFIEEKQIKSIYAINEKLALSNDKIIFQLPQFAHYQLHNFKGGLKQAPLKISVECESYEVVEKITSQFPMCNMLRFSGEDLFQITNKNAVKWNAVIALAEYLNIENKDIIAFGDDLNDLEMIENSGTGVAVENAVEQIKKVANLICRSNENDGVAHWIEDNLF